MLWCRNTDMGIKGRCISWLKKVTTFGDTPDGQPLVSAGSVWFFLIAVALVLTLLWHLPVSSR